MPTFRTKQNTTATYTAILKDENGVVIPLSELATFTLTSFDADDPTLPIINNRTGQDVKNVNNVTVHATSGLVTWQMTVLDNPINNEKLRNELHKALFTFTYSSPTKTGKHVVNIRVENLQRTP